jgi:hypothetical protein
MWTLASRRLQQQLLVLPAAPRAAPARSRLIAGEAPAGAGCSARTFLRAARAALPPPAAARRLALAPRSHPCTRPPPHLPPRPRPAAAAAGEPQDGRVNTDAEGPQGGPLPRATSTSGTGSGGAGAAGSPSERDAGAGATGMGARCSQADEPVLPPAGRAAPARRAGTLAAARQQQGRS